MHYFLSALDADEFAGLIRPALSACRRDRSFAPVGPLRAALAGRLRASADRGVVKPDEAIIHADKLPYDPHRWRMLAAEVLIAAAVETPVFQLSPLILARLLGCDRLDPDDLDRAACPPVYQVFFGSADLTFAGHAYRPGRVGWNDLPAVARLTADLTAIDPSGWTADALRGVEDLDEEEAAEEVAFTRDWVPALAEFYAECRDRRRVVVCERP